VPFLAEEVFDLIAIDGPLGSGKSTYAANLAIHHQTVVIPTDHFATWTDPVGWWPRLVDGVLEPLWRGEQSHYQRMEWHKGVPILGEWITVDVPKTLVIEGVSSARRAIASQLDLAIWVELPNQAERLERAVRRDGEENRGLLKQWQHFEQRWFAEDGTKARADRVILTD
jgi:uridine kinase